MLKLLAGWESMKEAVLSAPDDVGGPMAFLMLTGARIMEVLPNKKYQTSLLISDALPKGRGVVELPLVLKKRKRKGVRRVGIIYDVDLWKKFISYLEKRLRWEGSLLEGSWFYPRPWVNTVYYHVEKNLPFEEAVKRAVPHPRLERFILNYKFMIDPVAEKPAPTPSYWVPSPRMKTTYEILTRSRLLWTVFPFTYISFYRRLQNLEIETEFIDLQSWVIERRKKGLYTHAGREYLVNTLLSKGANVSELKELLGWDKLENINYYVRQTAEAVKSLIEKFSVVS